MRSEEPEDHRTPTDPASLRALDRWRVAVVEQVELVVHLLRWIVLGAVSGVLAGLSSFVFLEGLDRITEYRLDHDRLVWLLPAAGLVIGAAYHYLGGRAVEGNALLIDQIHEPTSWVPRRMAPLVLVGSWVTHLFGGSAGREGTAVQMSGSLTDLFARTIRLDTDDRRLLLVTALAGGFGAVFGVPLAGAVFALEVQSVGRIRYEALVPALAASLIGDLVVHGLGYDHAALPQIDSPLDGALLAKVAVAGLAFGLAGAAFAELTDGVKAFLAGRIGWAPLRPVVGGVGVVGLASLFGHDYLGLSLPLIDRSLAGDHLTFAVFALKILFTALTLGCGFPGGEVTPLFVIGATLGSALAAPLHLDVTLLAAVGFVAVFAGAANTPLACTIMGVELFGAGAVLPLAVGCVIAYVFSSHRGIYPTQRIHAAKGPNRITGRPTLRAWGTRTSAQDTDRES
ncbi:MAG: chloride channel protein [Actinobacteria bacterium]|nr:chloride channel protein [Actinomycetota bacterium]